MERHPPILDKLKDVYVPTKEEAMQRFEELAERFGSTWIGRASRDRLKKMAEGQE